jgi:hypothetical protein
LNFFPTHRHGDFCLNLQAQLPEFVRQDRQLNGFQQPRPKALMNLDRSVSNDS